MEPGNMPPPPPPPLPTCKPPQFMGNGATSPHPEIVGVSNGHHQSPVDDSRQELMSEIRDGVKLKAKRDQILYSSVRMKKILL